MQGKHHHSPETVAVDVALDHAIRRWEAEVETERQILQRENSLLTIVSAVLGLGLFRLDVLDAPAPALILWLVRILALAGLVLLLLSLSRLVLTSPHTSSHPPSSVDPGVTIESGDPLRWSVGFELDPSTIADVRKARLYSLDLMTVATDALHEENSRRRREIERGQRYLLASALCLGLGVTAWVVGLAGLG